MAESSEHEDENLSQIVERTRKISLSEKANLSEENYSEELSNPLTWNECLEKFDDIDWETLLKFKLSRESHEWRTFSFSILLGCVQTHLKKEEAAATFDSCEKLLEENKDDKFFVDILDGLEHILSSSRLILFRKTGSEEAVEEILPRVKCFRELNKVSQAAVYSMKGYLLCLFGYEAKFEALKYARLAIELDPDDLGLRRGAWYYHAGKILAQIRHTKSFCEMPSVEEIRFLEKSVEKDPFLVHLSLLAETYREVVRASRRLPYHEREPEFHYQILLKKAKRMYEICVNDKSASVAVLTCCGMGLIKLPRNLKNVECAKEAFQRPMESGCRRATIGMGYLFDWCLKDYRKALYYFEEAYSKNAVKAGVEIIKVKYKIDRKYNPLEDCDKYIKDLEGMLEARQKYELTVAYCMIKAEYLLVERKDLLAAVGEWKIAMNQHYDSKYLWESKCFFASNSPLKLCNLISMEIKKSLEERKFVGFDEIYLKETLEKFPQQCKDYDDRKVNMTNIFL